MRALQRLAPTMEGQYILKNLVLISGAIVVGATTRGAKLASAKCCKCKGPCRCG